MANGDRINLIEALVPFLAGTPEGVGGALPAFQAFAERQAAGEEAQRLAQIQAAQEARAVAGETRAVAGETRRVIEAQRQAKTFDQQQQDRERLLDQQRKLDALRAKDPELMTPAERAKHDADLAKAQAAVAADTARIAREGAAERLSLFQLGELKEDRTPLIEAMSPEEIQDLVKLIPSLAPQIGIMTVGDMADVRSRLFDQSTRSPVLTPGQKRDEFQIRELQKKLANIGPDLNKRIADVRGDRRHSPKKQEQIIEQLTADAVRLAESIQAQIRELQEQGQEPAESNARTFVEDPEGNIVEAAPGANVPGARSFSNAGDTLMRFLGSLEPPSNLGPGPARVGEFKQ